MKLAYSFSHWQFGKVLTPLKVHAARLPPAFGLFYGKISRLDKKLTLPPETVLLIREQVAHLNVCLFCMDIARSFTIKASMNEAKFEALEDYRTSALFGDAERAALDYVTELTKEKRSTRTLLLAWLAIIPNARSVRSYGLSPASISITLPISV
jgi:alkylhydroperoxidase family enzyme